MLGDGGIARVRGGGAERGTARVERHAVDAPMRLVDGLIDAGELLLADDVGREPRLDLGEPRVVRLLVRLDDAGVLVEGGRLGGFGLGGLERSHGDPLGL